ncbi:hypothetical protein LTR37_003121 [Vermiconidia calcicola]|uniref:Uncharacterized protein n=1 Tax=Vermiconidia calcicola TaxID=1690605 RepID=A0ACC3NSP2_9PEZI|nr:hypothetical protein LTR37_003121 [Vermiconidia calcicola]
MGLASKLAAAQGGAAAVANFGGQQQYPPPGQQQSGPGAQQPPGPGGYPGKQQYQAYPGGAPVSFLFILIALATFITFFYPSPALR